MTPTLFQARLLVIRIGNQKILNAPAASNENAMVGSLRTRLDFAMKTEILTDDVQHYSPARAVRSGGIWFAYNAVFFLKFRKISILLSGILWEFVIRI